MKILTSTQIRELDAYTIRNEPISSWALMERASRAFVQWLLGKFDEDQVYHVFCGMGNNGGDGLAIARMLCQKGHSVKVYLVMHKQTGSPDFEVNLRLLTDHLSPIRIETGEEMQMRGQGVVIDALLGSGLSKPVGGVLALVIETINRSCLTIVSVDIASGLPADGDYESGASVAGKEPDLLSPVGTNVISENIIRPDYTVSFQVPKPVFFVPEYGPFVGDWQVVDIGLDAGYLESLPSHWCTTSRENLPHLLRKRGKFSHKGTYGHALIVGGSYGKMGAAVLASRACLRSGVGLLSAYIPGCGYQIMQTAVPEAMVVTDPGDHYVTSIPDLANYAAIGIGPGLGTAPESADALEKMLSLFEVPMVLDADALNILSMEPSLLKSLPSNAVLTPHPREFSRLAGASVSGFEMISRAQDFAASHKVIICLKGAHTAVVLPDSRVFFNVSGNPGMATGGSGDVLTGMILGLLAQGYQPEIAARLAVFKHGEAGDRVAALRTQAALVASDLIESLRW